MNGRCCGATRASLQAFLGSAVLTMALLGGSTGVFACVPSKAVVAIVPTASGASGQTFTVKGYGFEDGTPLTGLGWHRAMGPTSMPLSRFLLPILACTASSCSPEARTGGCKIQCRPSSS
jgi:hypothetical protein